MTERLLRIRIRPIGQEAIQRVTSGITRAAQSAAREQIRANATVTREAMRSARSRERDAQRLAQAQARSSQQAADATARAAQTAARAQERAAQQASRAQQREIQALARADQRSANETFRTRQRLRQREEQEQARAQRSRAQMLGMIGGAALGAGRAIAGRVQGYQAALGMPTRDELMQSFVERQRATIRLAHQAGLQSGDIAQRVDTTAARSGVRQADLLAGLQYAQTTLATPDFNALDVFSRHLDEIADASYATGTPIEDLIGALGQMRNQFGITEDDFSEMVGAMVSMANDGSIEIGDLAANFTREMGQFRQLRSGVSGVDAAREFAATAEAIGRALPQAPEEAATQFRAVMTMLSTGRSQRGIEAGLRRGGLSREESDVFDRNGRMTVSMPELIARMRRAHLDTPAALEQANIRNVRARAGLATLLTEDPGAYQSLIASSADEGNRMIAETNAELRGSAAGRVDHERAQAEANFAEHGEGVVNAAVDMAAGLTELETRFPAATEALGLFSDAVSNIGGFAIGGGVLARMAAGGSVAGALGLGGAAASGGTGGAVAAAAGRLATPLLAGGGLGIAGGAVLANFVNPEHTGTTAAGDAADREGGASAHEGQHLSAAARDELIRQRQALGAQGGELQRRVIAGVSSGARMHPEDIRALADAISRGVASAIPDGPPASSLGDLPASRRVPREER